MTDINGHREIKPGQLLDCGHTASPCSSFTVGYGWCGQGDPSTHVAKCYECCGINGLTEMQETGREYLYLTIKDGKATVSNWPGTITFFATVKKGRHNIAGTRYDCWFLLGKEEWHGVQYGENTQIVHCKRTKRTSGYTDQQKYLDFKIAELREIADARTRQQQELMAIRPELYGQA